MRLVSRARAGPQHALGHMRVERCAASGMCHGRWAGDGQVACCTGNESVHARMLWAGLASCRVGQTDYFKRHGYAQGGQPGDQLAA